MAIVVKDRVRVTSTTTGTGTFTLGSAVDGFQDFSALVPNATWNISTTVFSGDSFSVLAQETFVLDVFFKSDGTKMYVCGSSGEDVNEYDLSSAWDITTASYLQNFSVAGQDTTPTGLFFKPDGTKMYILGDDNLSVYEYDLSTAWDVSSASYLQSFSVSAQESAPLALFFKYDGTKMYVCGSSGDDVNEYDLSTPWDISTASYLQNASVAVGIPCGLSFRLDGAKMYVGGTSDDNILEYDLSTPWDVSTAVYVQQTSVNEDGTLRGIYFRPDGKQFFTVGTTTDSVYSYYIGVAQTYYAITDGTDWEVGIGTYANADLTLSRDTILESSNSNAAVDWPAGDKDVIVTFPSENTQGTVPTGDNSSVGTDLVAWLNLKKTLDAGVVNGVPYANNSTNGIGSTYSLLNTVNNAYQGGTLSSNGEIHFIPNVASVGQKINTLTNVVSTYSLVYTTNSGAYRGGVLASNGDIHFVRWQANRGQKVSASGVVSTYSLVHTAVGQTYFGGVLAPNGDIHFVPFSAPVGQKISAAGVVSTYSLIYTTTSAYLGGVLAPNGDIHFVPYEAAVGQKVSAAGVVSTYSLIYTTSVAYSGGAIAINGDVYFVPRQAAVGQKISATGVVSTYSLVYTTSTGAYQGGVLAPNGDIHFVPYDAPVGQRISATGVVSTYSLAYTAASAFTGGVLAPNGDIHFIPRNANRGQKISTGVQVEPGFALSPFFNKF